MAKTPFTINRHLTAIAIAYGNQKLIADQVLPYVPVNKSEFAYTLYKKEDGFTVPETLVGRKGRVNQVEFGSEQVPAKCVTHALEDVVPQADLDDADPSDDPKGKAIENIMKLILLNREIRVAALAFTKATYANSETLSGTGQFSDYVNSKPIDKILTKCDECIVRPTKAIIGQQAWTKVRQHPDLVKATHGNSGDSGAAAREAVAEILELDEIIVGQGFINTQAKGLAPVYTRVWGKHIALIHQVENISTTNEATFGFTARHGNRVAREFFDEDYGLEGGHVVKAGEKIREVIAANDLGFFLENVVA